MAGGAHSLSTCRAVRGCQRPVRARGWCELHYRRWKRTGTFDVQQEVVCEGCGYTLRSCNLWRHTPVCPGDPLTLERLLVIGKVEIVGECWEWRGLYLRSPSSDDLDRYGLLPPIAADAAGEQRAHRVALSLSLGRPLASVEQALHHCDNPPCVRPDHLFAGVNSDNVADRVRKGRSRTSTRHLT